MRTGVVIRPWDGPNVVDDAVAGARAALDAGVRRVWFGQLFAEDAVALAGLVAREVPGVEVGVAALPVFARHPVLVGSAARTAQAAARGRFRLGLALGAPALVEAAFGVPYERPVARLREFLQALDPLLETGATDHHGDLITATTPVAGAVAGSRPRPPVLVGAMGPRALQVSGELADGVLPRLAGPRVLAERIVPTVEAAAAGRPAPAVVANVPAVVTANPAATRRAITDFLAFFEEIPSYRRILDEEGVDRAGDLAVVGDEDAVAEGLQRYVDAGATELIVETDAADPADRERTWRLLGHLES